MGRVRGFHDAFSQQRIAAKDKALLWLTEDVTDNCFRVQTTSSNVRCEREGVLQLWIAILGPTKLVRVGEPENKAG